MARLTVIHGPDSGQVFDLPSGTPQLVGRSSEAIPSTDRAMSRRHAELTPEMDGGWSIRDLASRFGTFVSGERVTGPLRLTPGDRVHCGGTVYRFEVLSQVGVVPAASAAVPSAEAAVPALAHSIKNILQGLRGGTDTIEMALARGDVELARRGWPLVARNIDRIYSLSLNLLAMARPRPLDRAPAAIGEVVRDVVALAASAASRRGVTVETIVAGGGGELWLDIASIHHALLNLVLNAVEAAPPTGGRVEVRTGIEQRGGSEWMVVTITDNGAGVPAAVAGQLFEAFVSSKGQRGSGLGLPVARHIARAHGGDVEWDRQAGEGAGTCFVVRLPMGRPAADPDETTGPASSDPSALDARFR